MTGLTPKVLALLNEIAAALETLAAGGGDKTIDLRRPPLLADEQAALRAFLGSGEVAARIEALGPSEVCDTAVAGVWWITHCKPDHTVIGEFIAITCCPDLLAVSPEEVRRAAGRFAGRLAVAAADGSGEVSTPQP